MGPASRGAEGTRVKFCSVSPARSRNIVGIFFHHRPDLEAALSGLGIHEDPVPAPPGDVPPPAGAPAQRTTWLARQKCLPWPPRSPGPLPAVCRVTGQVRGPPSRIYPVLLSLLFQQAGVSRRMCRSVFRKRARARNRAAWAWRGLPLPACRGEPPP